MLSWRQLDLHHLNSDDGRVREVRVCIEGSVFFFLSGTSEAIPWAEKITSGYHDCLERGIGVEGNLPSTIISLPGTMMLSEDDTFEIFEFLFF